MRLRLGTWIGYTLEYVTLKNILLAFMNSCSHVNRVFTSFVYLLVALFGPEFDNHLAS